MVAAATESSTVLNGAIQFPAKGTAVDHVDRVNWNLDNVYRQRQRLFYDLSIDHQTCPEYTYSPIHHAIVSSRLLYMRGNILQLAIKMDEISDRTL